MPQIKSRLALAAVLCLVASAAAADPLPAAVTTPAPPVMAPAPAAAMITLAQADAIIMQSGFTPVGQPKQKGNIIGSLARLGNNAFIVTVDATTGQFLDAKPTTIALPAMAATTAPAALAPAPAAPAAVAAPPTPPATAAVSPVGRAAAIARAQGFAVLSFTHRSDDTFLVARRHGQLFSLKIDDKGRVLQVAPVHHREHDGD